MKIKDIVTIETATVNPMDYVDVCWHLYSLPSFDDGKQREEVFGTDIQSNKYIVPDKCILFNKLNIRFKRIWQIENTEEYKICSTEFLPLVVNEAIADYNFVYYLLHSDTITSYLSGQNSNTSSSHKRIDPNNFMNIEVNLPSLSEQQKIGSFLANLDDKISINSELNKNLEAMAKQLYDYWFVQFDFPDENGRPYKSSGGKMVWNKELKREIPEGWGNGTLGDIANITMGQSPSGSSYNDKGQGVLFYQGSTDFGIRFPSVRQYTTMPSRYANKGDILMSVRAPVGALNIANNDCCIGRGLAALNSKLGSNTHLYYILDNLRSVFEQRNDIGTTFGSITKDELHSLPVVKPKETTMKAFYLFTRPFFDKQMEIGFEIESLTKQRDELLPLLMNGQVSVNSYL